jgi:hypothetical protein
MTHRFGRPLMLERRRSAADRALDLDTQTGGHATTSDDLAGALINANPGRFQPVSPSGYIPGIDY